MKPVAKHFSQVKSSVINLMNEQDGKKKEFGANVPN